MTNVILLRQRLGFLKELNKNRGLVWTCASGLRFFRFFDADILGGVTRRGEEGNDFVRKKLGDGNLERDGSSFLEKKRIGLLDRSAVFVGKCNGFLGCGAGEWSYARFNVRGISVVLSWIVSAVGGEGKRKGKL